jgi:AraC-like DNA-binding protein
MTSVITPHSPELPRPAAGSAAGGGPHPAEEGRRSMFSTRNAAEGLAVLDEVFAVREVRTAANGQFRMVLSSAGLGPVAHERLRLGGSSATGNTDGTGVLRVGHVLGGVLTALSGGDRFPRSGPFLFPQRTFSSWWEDLDLATLSVGAAVVEEHARRLLDDEGFRLEFTGNRPVTPEMSRYWTSTMSHLSRDVLPNDEVMRVPLVRDEAVRSVVTALLHAFPNSFLDRAGAASSAARAAPAGVRRAVAFIEERLDSDIGLVEICAAARMSPRGLQAAFRRELGSTPIAYLRDARLDAAHRDLLAADPTTGATVEAVAARWGFTHRGRFAAAYRERHGRSPVASLRA